MRWDIYKIRTSNVISWFAFLYWIPFLLLALFALATELVDTVYPDRSHTSLGLTEAEVDYLDYSDIRGSLTLQRLDAREGDFVILETMTLISRDTLAERILHEITRNLDRAVDDFVPFYWIVLAVYIINYIALGNIRFLPWRKITLEQLQDSGSVKRKHGDH